jgi:hypothetical protein
MHETFTALTNPYNEVLVQDSAPMTANLPPDRLPVPTTAGGSTNLTVPPTGDEEPKES